ncbi:MAG: ATP-binding cassette domain-containing protein [Clostridia bacterium]|nr:ATP-binding cassette domain-containing protein [Clostridia bacterium]
MEILNIDRLSFTYSGAEAPVLKDVTFSLAPGSFTVLMGESGSGKSTLLRLIKKELSPRGKTEGKISLLGKPVSELTPRESAFAVGFVAQLPEEQIVTDRVWHELAFTGESAGMEDALLRRRVGEIASYFGMGDWFRRETDTLSGGQKQLLTLASVLAGEPALLLLDEPTSRLDPVAEGEFLSLLERLNRELGLTVLLATHDPARMLGMADRLLYLEDGVLCCDGTPRKVCAGFPEEKLPALPAVTRVWHKLGKNGECPLTLREGRALTEKTVLRPIPLQEPSLGAPVLQGKELCFRFARDGAPLCDRLSFTLREGEHLAVVGGNGSGKTTLLRLLCGFLKPLSGKILLEGKPLQKYGGDLWYHRMAYLPQEPAALFGEETVGEEYLLYCKKKGIDPAAAEELAARLGVSHLWNRHPLDLSGGELQLCALGRVLLQQPKVLLLDEPTKGVDAFAVRRLEKILQELTAEGTAILTVTHDLEFAGRNAHTCALLFDGVLSSPQPAERFFAQNRFYTTDISRMTKGVCATEESLYQSIYGKERNHVTL